MTDTGYINQRNFNKLKNHNMYILESNHDIEMLMTGPYPYHLKQRILGDKGHLSNKDSAYYIKGDLLKEMQLDSAMRNQINVSKDFVRVPYDYYEQLQEALMEMIPDFRIRLKVNPKTHRVVFAADVNSIFDICMYTLARKISDDVSPEERTGQKNEYKGIVMSCPFCGEAFVRKSNRSVTCGKEECDKARKRTNKQNSRKKARINSAK